MINETILYLVHKGCSNSRLKKHQEKMDASLVLDLDIRVGGPLKKVFSKVLHYDFGGSYSESGVLRTNNDIIDLVRAERPKYVIWPSISYEILESTFQAIRKEGILVIGWFFDDEKRFDDYSKWWIPYLDYILSTDKERIKEYQKLGASTMYMLMTAGSEFFIRMEIEKRYDVTFVGTKYADRGSLINEFAANGIVVHSFGSRWSNGAVLFDEMVNIYNASKINLCFVKTYDVSARPQMKGKIFEICMCGGFLLCEYIPGIEEFFELDEEIVCFRNIEEATAKIQYYLDHESEREAIAQAGWERAKRDHDQSAWMLKVFEEIEKDTKTAKRSMYDDKAQLEMPSDVRTHPSLFHLNWAIALMEEGFDKQRWQEELDLALFYDPENTKALWFSRIGHFHAPVLILLIHLRRLKKKLEKRIPMLRSYRSSIPLLRKIKQTLIKAA